MAYRKLTLKQKKKLCELAAGGMEYQFLAERYSISKSTVTKVIQEGKKLKEK